MAPVEPLTRMDLPVVAASLLTMVTEHLVEAMVEALVGAMVEEPPLPVETTALLVVDLVEEEEAAPLEPAAHTGLLEVDLRVDSEVVPPLPVDHTALLEVGLEVEAEAALVLLPLAAHMELPGVDVAAMEVELEADVVQVAPHPPVDHTVLQAVGLRADLVVAPHLPVDLTERLLLEVVEDLEALVAVTRLGMAMPEELPQPVDHTELQVAEEAREDLEAALHLLVVTTALLAVVTSPDMDLAEAAEEGPAAGTASSSSDPGEARPHPLTGRTSATSLAGPPSLTGSRTRTSRQQPTTR